MTNAKNQKKEISNISVALNYARQGMPVFPCDPQTKRPLTPNGFHSATKDVSTVRWWWKKYPKALVGSPTKNYTILDVDVKKEKNGFDIIEDLGEPFLAVTTPSGGKHYYYGFSTKRNMKHSKYGVDILGEGGYAILPDGRNYVVEDGTAVWEKHRLIKRILKATYFYRQEQTNVYRLDQSVIREQSKKKKKNKSVGRNNKDVRSLKRESKSNRTGDYSAQSPDDRPLFSLADQSFSHEFTEKLFQEKYKNYFQEIGSDVVTEVRRNPELQAVLYDLVANHYPGFEEGKTNSIQVRSELEDHEDVHPSTRFIQDKNVIYYVDYSMFHGTIKGITSNNTNVYDVVHLYFNKVTGKIKHLNKYEYMLWIHRMCYEAGILVIPEERKNSFEEDKLRFYLGRELFDEMKHCFDLIMLRFKLYYDEINDGIGMTRNFTALWCGVTEQKALVLISLLVRMGHLKECGRKLSARFENCSYALYQWHSDVSECSYPKPSRATLTALKNVWSSDEEMVDSFEGGLYLYVNRNRRRIKDQLQSDPNQTIRKFLANRPVVNGPFEKFKKAA